MQLIHGISEKILIDRFIQGDETAFELLFRHYYPGLVIFASQITLDRAEAEEIVQDFFFRMWKNRERIKETSTLKSYVFTSVRNRGINFLVSKNHEARKIDELKRVMSTNLTYQPDVFVNSELQEKLKRAFEKLPPRTKEIFILSRFNELKNDEIAEKLNLSKRTVELQISNALKILRQELKEYSGLLFLLGIFS